MSYDVTIGPFESNMTSNVSAMFHEHIVDEGNGTGLQSLSGLTGKEASRRIANAFDRIHKTWRSDWTDTDIGDAKFRSRYDAKNGWGSTVGALIWLAQIMAACQSHPRAKFHISA